MSDKYKTYTTQQKKEAVHRVVEMGHRQTDVAREMGIHHNTLSSWVVKYRDQHDEEEEIPEFTSEDLREMRRMRRQALRAQFSADF
ncbi:MAG: transposase [Corynebacterium sp.]|nr:transposase [Corynebacterium sp.]